MLMVCYFKMFCSKQGYFVKTETSLQLHNTLLYIAQVHVAI